MTSRFSLFRSKLSNLLRSRFLVGYQFNVFENQFFWLDAFSRIVPMVKSKEVNFAKSATATARCLRENE